MQNMNLKTIVLGSFLAMLGQSSRYDWRKYAKSYVPRSYNDREEHQPSQTYKPSVPTYSKPEAPQCRKCDYSEKPKEEKTYQYSRYRPSSTYQRYSYSSRYGRDAKKNEETEKKVVDEIEERKEYQPKERDYTYHRGTLDSYMNRYFTTRRSNSYEPEPESEEEPQTYSPPKEEKEPTEPHQPQIPIYNHERPSKPNVIYEVGVEPGKNYERPRYSYGSSRYGSNRYSGYRDEDNEIIKPTIPKEEPKENRYDFNTDLGDLFGRLRNRHSSDQTNGNGNYGFHNGLRNGGY